MIVIDGVNHIIGIVEIMMSYQKIKIEGERGA